MFRNEVSHYRSFLMAKLLSALLGGMFAVILGWSAFAVPEVTKVDAKAKKEQVSGAYKAAKAKIKKDAETAEVGCKKLSGAGKATCKKMLKRKEGKL